MVTCLASSLSRDYDTSAYKVHKGNFDVIKFFKENRRYS